MTTGSAVNRISAESRQRLAFREPGGAALQGFLPWVLYFLFSDPQHALFGSLLSLAAHAILGRDGLRKKRILLHFPKAGHGLIYQEPERMVSEIETFLNAGEKGN